MERSWILIGMMGAGKSSVGRLLAEQTGRSFFDTDSLLVQKLGRPIPQLFRLYGESTFREHETSVLRGLEPENLVLATGGGIVLRPDNWQELRRLGITVYLDASIATLVERLGRTRHRRPLLAGDDWEEKIASILETRRPMYAQADVTVKVDDLELEDTVKAIRKVLEGES